MAAATTAPLCVRITIEDAAYARDYRKLCKAQRRRWRKPTAFDARRARRALRALRRGGVFGFETSQEGNA